MIKWNEQEALVIAKEFDKAQAELAKAGAENLLVPFDQFQQTMLQIKIKNPEHFKQLMIEHLELN